MSKAKKIGIVLILVGVCLPSATLPFITQFKPVPELCLTSNFFQNMGNMVVVFGVDYKEMMSINAQPLLSIPYRYLFAVGVILFCVGTGIILISPSNTSKKRD